MRARGALKARRRWVALTLLLALSLALAAAGAAAPPAPGITVYTDQLADPSFMGLGVELDPYDTLSPSQLDWPLMTERLDFMSPGVLRVVEPASSYFAGYDAAGDPTYKWTSSSVLELLSILTYAQSHGITVVLGDWGNPLIGGDARIPAEFIGALHTQYGLTDLRYYNVMNEPNDTGTSCQFTCWEGIMKAVSAEFHKLGYEHWISLVGPDNANSWDDTAAAQALDRSSGLDSDNPLDGDAWVTDTLHSISKLIGAYDSHRYATIWGVENGVFGNQVLARREEISNLASPAKPYFDAEVGLTARQVTPFTARSTLSIRAFPSLLDPSASTFVDSQPNIATYNYGVWMGDMMIQAIAGGLSGASAWDLDDAMHTGGGYGSKNLKQWGFFNTLGGQDGYPASDLEPRPWYYAWSVLSRAFPAGSQTLATPATGTPGLRVAAARIPHGAGYDLSIAAVNDSTAPHSISLSVPSLTKVLPMAQYDYFPTSQPVDAIDQPVPAHTAQIGAGATTTVALPASSMVVLTSHGFAARVRPDQGRTTLLDDLSDLHLTYAHSRALKLDHRHPSEYNYAPSRAAASGKHNVFLAYRAGQMTSFELKAYYPDTLRILAYGSENDLTWTPIALASTVPAPAVGGHELLAELFPRTALPAGTNELKVVLGPYTELAQVRIMADRSGPACLASDLATGGSSIGGVSLGAAGGALLGLLGAPSLRGRRAWGYCVTGGGQVGLVLTREDAVSLVVSTAAGYRVRGVGPGTPVATLRSRYAARELHTVGGDLIVSSGGVVFVTRGRVVEAVGLATPALLANRHSLAGAVKLALSP